MQARAEPADTDMILGTLIFTKHEAEYSIKTFRVGSQSWSCAPGAMLLLFSSSLDYQSVYECLRVCARARAGVASVSRSGAFSPISSLPMPVSSSLPAHLSLMSYATELKFRVLAKLSISIKSWCACVLLTSCAQDPLCFLVGSRLPTSRRFLSTIHFTSEPRTLYTYSLNNLWTNSRI